MKNDGRKILAKYLISLGIIDFFRIYYGMGIIAKIVLIILRDNKNAFTIALFGANLIIYLCFLTVFVVFYKKIKNTDDRDIIALYYMWTAMFVLLPLINLLGLGVMEQSALQTQTMTVEFDNAIGWAAHMMITAVHIICMILTGCYFRQLRYGIVGILLGIVYFIGWRESLFALTTDIALYNNIKLGSVMLTGLLLVVPKSGKL
ncbi:MAG: hypothetical protein Q4C73_02220 [Eubacteriales bacterium]|nr:hypothetical protein [Eubacteriales bacterium]